MTMFAAHGNSSRSGARDTLLVVAATVLAAVLAFALAPTGTLVLYVLIALIVLGGLAYVLRDDLRPALHQIAARARPRASARLTRRSRVATVVGATVAAVAVGLLAFLMVSVGLLAAAAFGALIVLSGVVWLFWPLLHDLAMAQPDGVATARPARDRATRSRTTRALGLVIVIGATGVASFALAQIGLKGLLAAVGVIVMATLLFVVRNRSEFFTFVSVASLTFVLYKSFTTQDLQQSGGAIAVYVTTFDAMVLVLYGIWIHEGTFATDVRVAVQQRVLWVPLIGAVFLLPSLLGAPSTGHAAAELFRMVWMYLLFFYVAVRVRTRRHVWAVLGGLAVFATIEFIVVVLQWKTGGVLGLSFLGVPTTLTQRVTDTSSLGRPFGTIIHPVFMGAVMGSLALLALSLAINLRRSLAKIAAAAMIVVCAVPLYLSHTRASALAAILASVFIIGSGLARGRLRWNTIGRFALAGLVGVAVFWPQLSAKFSENFGTGHFWEEIQSRLQLNGIAFNMWNDHWLTGVGLNNFEVVLPRYEPHFVIFFGNPVHNIYLLYLSEVGVIGLLGFMIVGLGMFRASLLATRTTDRLLSGVSIGVVGLMIFLGLEELLGFSLRQDIPLAMYWLLSGLTVACRTIARTTPPAAGEALEPDAPLPPARPLNRSPKRARTRVARATGPRGRVAGGVALLVIAAAAVPLATASQATTAMPSKIVFEATVRATGASAIFTANNNGTGIKRVSPNDGRNYDWPRWAFDNRKIVYTARRGQVGSPENIEMMNADGSGRQVISKFAFQVAQPTVDATGKWMIFTAAPPWFPNVAVFKMNLRTLQSRNLTAVTTPKAGIDADPVLSQDQSTILMIAGHKTRADIDEINFSGRNRQILVQDGYFNTDPDLSPNGRHIAIASYRGPSTPDKGGLVARTDNFHLVDRAVGSGVETVLTQGLNCAKRSTSNPCTVAQMSAYLPRYFDDGHSLAFDGALDNQTTCICAINVSGHNPRVILSSTTLAIEWYDFQHPKTGAKGAKSIGSDKPQSRVLVTQLPSNGAGRATLYSATPDLMHRTAISLPKKYSPLQARWNKSRSQIVFVSRVKIPASAKRPHPAAPSGQHRRVHTTLTTAGDHALPRSDAQEQVFVRSANGKVRQLTDPWIEDWHDGLKAGDVRANIDPVFSNDGKSVIVTNVSTKTGESFLLRVSRNSKHVYNLTNATSGALPVNDSAPAVSPNGKQIAFSTLEGGVSDIFVMNASNGRNVREVTHTNSPDSAPVWMPNGKSVLSVTTRNGYQVIVRTNVTNGQSLLLSTRRQGTAAAPVVSPAGDRFLFIGDVHAPNVHTRGIYTEPVGGGRVPSLAQPDPTHQIVFVDWR
jgi:Tol biopolymer transport system component/O-antigen ligase